MKSFRGYISEEVLPTAQVADGGLDIEKPAVRAAINAALAGVTSQPAVTPYVVYNHISKLLSQYHIILPRKFLEGDKGVEVFEVRQFGLKMGMTDSGEFVSQVPTTHYLFLQYGLISPFGVTYAKPTVGGMYRVTARLVDKAELDRLLDMAEITMSEEASNLSEAGAFSYGHKKPRKGSVTYNAMMQRKKQERDKPPIEPKDQMVGVAKVHKDKKMSEEAEVRQNAAKACAPKEPMHDVTSDEKKKGNKEAVADSQKGLDEAMKIVSKGYGNVHVVKGGKTVKKFNDPRDAHMFVSQQGKKKTVKEEQLDELHGKSQESISKITKANYKKMQAHHLGHGHPENPYGQNVHRGNSLLRLQKDRDRRKTEMGPHNKIDMKKDSMAWASQLHRAGNRELLKKHGPVKEEKGDRLTPGLPISQKNLETVAKDLASGQGGASIVTKGDNTRQVNISTNSPEPGNKFSNRVTDRQAKFESVIKEKLTKRMSAGDIISDFVHSDNPKFKGKSKKERQRMALGAYYSKHPEKSKKLDEISKETLGSYITKAAHSVSRSSAERAGKVGRDVSHYGSPEFEKSFAKSTRRHKGIQRAVDRLTKE